MGGLCEFNCQATNGKKKLFFRCTGSLPGKRHTGSLPLYILAGGLGGGRRLSKENTKKKPFFAGTGVAQKKDRPWIEKTYGSSVPCINVL